MLNRRMLRRLLEIRELEEERLASQLQGLLLKHRQLASKIDAEKARLRTGNSRLISASIDLDPVERAVALEESLGSLIRYTAHREEIRETERETQSVTEKLLGARVAEQHAQILLEGAVRRDSQSADRVAQSEQDDMNRMRRRASGRDRMHNGYSDPQDAHENDDATG